MKFFLVLYVHHMVNTNLKYIPFSHDLRACLHLNHDDDMHYSIQEPKSKDRHSRYCCWDQNPTITVATAAQKVVTCTWLLMHILWSYNIIADAWNADGYFTYSVWLVLNKVGHLYCLICVGIEVSNLLRILLSKFISKASEFTVGFVSNVDRIRVPTVDDRKLNFIERNWNV